LGAGNYTWISRSNMAPDSCAIYPYTSQHRLIRVMMLIA